MFWSALGSNFNCPDGSALYISAKPSNWLIQVVYPYYRKMKGGTNYDMPKIAQDAPSTTLQEYAVELVL